MGRFFRSISHWKAHNKCNARKLSIQFENLFFGVPRPKSTDSISLIIEPFIHGVLHRPHVGQTMYTNQRGASFPFVLRTPHPLTVLCLSLPLIFLFFSTKQIFLILSPPLEIFWIRPCKRQTIHSDDIATWNCELETKQTKKQERNKAKGRIQGRMAYAWTEECTSLWLVIGTN